MVGDITSKASSPYKTISSSLLSPRGRAMQILRNPPSLAFYASSLPILLLPLANGSSDHEHVKTDHTHMSRELVSEIRVHGAVLWVSMGLLMPFGILTIRMANREGCGRRLKLLFYAHAASQMVSVLLATVGAVVSIKKFNNSFNNAHQRIGVGLYGLIWLQVFIGLLRPKRGSKGRGIWFFVHWVLGTLMCLLGVISIYTGLQAYHEKTSRSISFWTTLFTVQMSFLVFSYLLQDKWVHIKGQGVVVGSEQERPTSQELPRTYICKHKVSRTEPC